MINSLDKKDSGSVIVAPESLKGSNLSIQLSLDGLCFCVFNKYTQQYTHFQNIPFVTPAKTPEQLLSNVATIVENEPLFQYEYNNVFAVHCNNLVSIVPKPFFDEDHVADYLKYNIKVLKDDYIATDTIEHAQAMTVYIPFVNINNLLFSKFGAFEYKHAATTLIEKLLQLNTTEQQVYINVYSNSFEMVVLSKKQLQFFNVFEFETPEDFIYYILFTAEQLALNPEALKLTFLGNIDTVSSLYEITYQYIRHVQLWDHKNEKLSEALVELQNHQYFTLL